jgi:hypothetical protein
MARSTRQHSQVTSTLYCLRQASLMFCTTPASPSRHNLALTGNIPTQHRGIFVIDPHAPFTEGTNRRSRNEIPRTSCSSRYSSRHSSSGSSGASQILFSFSYSKGKSSGSSSPSSGREVVARLPRKSTRSAATSRLVRVCPSCPSQLRACNLPST